MTTSSVEDEYARKALIKRIERQAVPFVATITKGRKRSVAQNRLQRRWINEISEQLGDMTPEEVRAYCKLTIGVPILRAENEAFCEAYDSVIKPMSYEQKLAMMMEPLDFSVTRLMTTKQKTKYLNDMQRHFSKQGVILSVPDEMMAREGQAA